MQLAVGIVESYILIRNPKSRIVGGGMEECVWQEGEKKGRASVKLSTTLLNINVVTYLVFQNTH